MNTITHEEFIKGYRASKFIVAINKHKAGDFILSRFATKSRRIAHYILSWTGILFFPCAIILIFISLKYAALSFVSGLIFLVVSRRITERSILNLMITNEDFFDYILLHQGAKIVDDKGMEYFSAFLVKMQSQ